MLKSFKPYLVAVSLLSLGVCYAEEDDSLIPEIISTTELSEIPQETATLTPPSTTPLTTANELPSFVAETPPEKPKTPFAPFTGKVRGRKVRVRFNPELDGRVLKELSKGDLISIVGEKGDFWAIEPLPETKAYVFRSFVLDNTVEGNHVNVRLEPNLEAPIIGHLNSGDKVDGTISSQNSKWLEIKPPKSFKLYVAKDFVENIGGPELKGEFETRHKKVEELLQTTALLVKAELLKPFNEMDIERLAHNYKLVVSDYKDFPEFVELAQSELSALNETYLQRKIEYLENRVAGADEAIAAEGDKGESATDKMKLWEPIEESLYLTWSRLNEDRNMQEYYDEQKLNSTMLTGIVESYSAPVKNKPGQFIIRDDNDHPIAYVYSTSVNLDKFAGKKVNLVASPRPNNNFAFPAYYVHDVE